MAQPAIKEEKIKVVRISGQVLLKIVNHCQSTLPAEVHGTILGIDTGDNALEITASYPLIDVPDTSDGQAEYQDFQMAMMRQLREVNMDSNDVGWYCSTWWENFNRLDTIETQFQYQQNLGRNCVCIVYDPLKTTHGKLWLKAIRLTDRFADFYSKNDYTHETLRKAELTIKDIYEEIPIEIQNLSLINVFLGELARDKKFRDERYTQDNFELHRSGEGALPGKEGPTSILRAPSRYLVSSLEQLSDNIDELFNQYQQYALYSRKTPMNNQRPKDEKPSRLPSLLRARQIANHCDYVASTTKNTFENLCFAQVAQVDSKTTP